MNAVLRFYGDIMKTIFLFASILAMSGCATLTLTPEGEKVRVTKGEPAGCQNLGDVYGKGNGIPSSNMEYARTDIRNKAALKGANVLSLDSIATTDGVINLVGQAYKCP